MIILVSDTSVLIDLERGHFLDACFRLPFEFAVPDLLYRRELASALTVMDPPVLTGMDPRSARPRVAAEVHPRSP